MLAYPTVDHRARYVEARAFFDPHFPVYGQNRIFPYNTRIIQIRENIVQIRENMDTILFIYWQIWTKESPYFGIFHAMDNYKRLFAKQEKAVQNNV